MQSDKVKNRAIAPSFVFYNLIIIGSLLRLILLQIFLLFHMYFNLTRLVNLITSSDFKVLF